MFAAVIAAIVSLTLLTVLRLWQARGRLSLAITAFVLPALVALVCVGIMRLMPLAARQSTISMLRNSDIQFTLRVPTVNGEWVHDQTGFLIPLWLADRIGPDCLTTVRRMGANLEDLQNYDYRSIPTADLTEIRISRESREPRLQSDLIQWLGTCPRAELHVDIKHISKDEIELIEALPANFLKEAILGFEGEIPEFDLPGHPLQACFRGTTISAPVAAKLMDGRRDRFLTTIHVESLQPDAIKAACGDAVVRQLVWSGVQLTVEDIEAMSQQTVQHFGLFQVSLPPANAIRELAKSLPKRSFETTELEPFEDETAEKQLVNFAITGSRVSFQQLAAICQCFPYESISTDLAISPQQISELWAASHIKSITCVSKSENGQLKRAIFERGNDTPVQQYQLYIEPRDAKTGKVINVKN